MLGFRHDSVYKSFLAWIVVAVNTRRSCDVRTHTPTIPDTADVVAGNDLCEAASLDVADLDEATVKEKDIGRMEGHAFCGSFPFNGSG